MLLKVLSVHLMSLLVNNNETDGDVSDESEADTEQEQIQGNSYFYIATI